MGNATPSTKKRNGQPSRRVNAVPATATDGRVRKRSERNTGFRFSMSACVTNTPWPSLRRCSNSARRPDVGCGATETTVSRVRAFKITKYDYFCLGIGVADEYAGLGYAPPLGHERRRTVRTLSAGASLARSRQAYAETAFRARAAFVQSPCRRKVAGQSRRR